MKPKATDVCRDETMQEVWRLKEENAAAYGFDVDAIAAAASEHQRTHPHRIVSRVGDRSTDLNNGVTSSDDSANG